MKLVSPYPTVGDVVLRKEMETGAVYLVKLTKITGAGSCRGVYHHDRSLYASPFHAWEIIANPSGTVKALLELS